MEKSKSTLIRAITMFGKRRSLRFDNGSKFISREFDLWAHADGANLDFSRPGKPTDNAFVESFKARGRIECLNQHWFLDLDDARTKSDSWCRDYNDARPHSAIGERTPMAMFTAHKNSLWAQQGRMLSIKSVQIPKADHADAIVSIPLVQNIRQVTMGPADTSPTR